MKKMLNIKNCLIVICTLFLGCKTEEYSKMAEYDDLYYTSKDRLEAARLKAPEAKVVDTNQTPSTSSTTQPDVYIQGEEKKQPASSSGQSDTYIYNFDSRTFEKVPSKTPADTTNTGGQKK